MFLLAVSRRKKQRDTSNRSGWPLCFRESSKTTKSHSNLCCPFASALGFPFFQFPALSSFLLFFILLLLSVLSIVSTFSSFTFYVTNTTIFSLLLVIYLSCSLSLSPPLVLYLSFYSSVCPALSRYLCSAKAGKWGSLRLRRCSSPVSPVPPCTNLRELKY